MNEFKLNDITVFLDRDGVLNRDTGYITSPKELVLFPDVVQAIARLKQAGTRLVLITNQSAIARKYMTERELHLIHKQLKQELEVGGGSLDGIYFCPHHPDDRCLCRKPHPGLIQQATQELDIKVGQSYLVGDKTIDMKLANNVKSKGVLVKTSQFSKEALEAIGRKDIHVAFVASNFSEATNWIIEDALKSNEN